MTAADRCAWYAGLTIGEECARLESEGVDAQGVAAYRRKAWAIWRSMRSGCINCSQEVGDGESA